MVPGHMMSRTSASLPRGTDLAARYCEVRAATESLCEPLSAEDCAAQSMPEASPAKWHLAHTTWFFETFVLEQAVPDYRAFERDFRVLFNSYYTGIGEQHPRPQRGLLTRPGLDEVLAYRAHVDEETRTLLETDRLPESLARTIRLGLEHEQQHQELILTDAKHLFARNPTAPVYREHPGPPAGEAKPLTWHYNAGGVVSIGHDGRSFAFDNECPRHERILRPFELASRAITSAEFLAFMADDGYDRPELWLADGWTAVREGGWRAPLYWEQRDGSWHVFTLAGMRELCDPEPACHLSYYEADAYARWAAARLPTEVEWEHVAARQSVEGNFVESRLCHPAAAAPEAGALGPAQLFGDVWEWTQSAYGGYPGYRPPEGAVGEYNGKFMCSQLVLRGGSCATPRAHVRASYRNFFYPDARWQFSGVRLARDAD